MNNIINEIRNIASKYIGIEKIILFGSRARGDNRLKSDIDLAIYGEGDFSEFIFDLENEVNTLLEFDVTVISNGLDEVFMRQIKNEGVILYEKS